MIPHRIILHHSLTEDSQTVSWGAIRKYHVGVQKWLDIGYNFGLELIGDHYEILMGRMMNEARAHKKGYNSNSLGICFIGNFDEAPPPPDQWNLGIRLVTSLCQQFFIPPERVMGHREFTDTKSCPGKMFNLVEFRRQIVYDNP